MIWSEVRKAYPEQWLVIEALSVHTEGSQRLLDRIAVIDTCPDGTAAMQSYQRLHREYPSREFYFVHTSRESLDIRERRWHGIRRGNLSRVQYVDANAVRHPGVRGIVCLNSIYRDVLFAFAKTALP